MNTEGKLVVRGITVDVVRKEVKRLRVAVYPPDGAVRLTAPAHVSDDAARLAVVSKLGWIRRQRSRLEGQSRQSRREYVSGEAHFVWGKRYRLRILKGKQAKVEARAGGWLEVIVPVGQSGAARILDRWYRGQLRARAAPLFSEWQHRTGLCVEDWRIKRMKTRWGTCIPQSRRIWLNSELVKKSPRCLEFIIVHELAHLREPDHGARFQALMHEWLPDWRQRREELNAAPLANEHWLY